MSGITNNQLKRLGERLREGPPTPEDVAMLDEYRNTFAEACGEVAATMTKLGYQPTLRDAKTTASIVAKVKRERTRLSTMQDIAGCRVVVRGRREQDACISALEATLAIERKDDRIKNPSHGYRAIHLIARAKGKPVEIQVRTEFQHAWAQVCEKSSDVIDPGIKYGVVTKMSRYGGGARKSLRVQALIRVLPFMSDWTEKLERAEPRTMGTVAEEFRRLMLRRYDGLRRDLDEL